MKTTGRAAAVLGLAALLLGPALSARAGEYSAQIARFLREFSAKDAASRAQAVGGLAGLESVAVAQVLLRALADRELIVQHRAVEVLGGFTGPAVRDYLLEKAAKDPNPAVRAGALEALGRAGSSESLAGVRSGLADRDWEVRCAAARALGDLGQPDTAGALAPLLKDKDPRVRVSALDAVGKLGQEFPVDALGAALADPAWEVRAAAIGAIRTGKLLPALDALIPRLDAEDGRLRGDVARTLRELTGKDLGDRSGPWRDWWKVNRDRVIAAGGRGGDAGGRPDAPGAGPAPDPAGTAREGTTVVYHGIPSTSKAVLFVIDASASMLEKVDVARFTETGPGAEKKRRYESDFKLGVAREELAFAVNELPADATFNVILFQTDVYIWNPTMARATPENKKSAIDFVRKHESALVAFGRRMAARLELREGESDSRKSEADRKRTNLIDALRAAFRFAGPGRTDRYYPPLVDTVFILSDGMPTEGEYTTAEDILREVDDLNGMKKLVLHTIVVEGDQNNLAFMRALAERNGGQCVVLKP